jgi:hypothetical protein
VPVLFGAVAWAFRVLSVSDLSNDHYMTLGWAQQVLFGEWPERDFVEPGMPLSYLPSAVVQRYAPGPLSELIFTAGLLAAAAGVTLAGAARLSGSWTLGVLAALLALGFNTRLYGFPKALAPAVTVLLLQAYMAVPSRRRVMAVGAWTVIAALMRHDIGLFVGISVVVALLLTHGRDLRSASRAVGSAGLGGAIVFAPYAVYVQWAVGWPEHLRRGIEFAKSDAHQLLTGVPPLANLAAWTREGSIAFLFFASYLLLAACLVTLVARRRALEPADLGAAGATVALLAAFLPVILRHPVENRLGDTAVVFSLAWAWILGQASSVGRLAWREGRRGRATVLLLVALTAATATIGNVWAFGRVSEQIDNTGIHAGWRGIRETWAELRDGNVEWPWAPSWPSRELPVVVRYLNECTTEADAIMLTWPAPEYNFFARRRFAAGHVELLPPNSFATEEDQRQMLDTLGQQRVPIVMTNRDRYEEFARTYPRLAGYLERQYRPFGTFTIYDGATIELAIAVDARPTRTWGPEGWPCRPADQPRQTRAGVSLRNAAAP